MMWQDTRASVIRVAGTKEVLDERLNLISALAVSTCSRVPAVFNSLISSMCNLIL